MDMCTPRSKYHSRTISGASKADEPATLQAENTR
jgi:hypothetical protein